MKLSPLVLSLLAAPALAQVRSMARFEPFTNAACSAKAEKVQGVPIKNPVIYMPAGECGVNPFNVDGAADKEFLKVVCPTQGTQGSYTTHRNSDCADAATSTAAVTQGSCLNAYQQDFWARVSCEEVNNTPVETFRGPARFQEYSDNNCQQPVGDVQSLAAPACVDVEGTFAIPKCLNSVTRDGAQVIFELFQASGCATSSNLFVTGEMKTSTNADECIRMTATKSIKYTTNQVDVCPAATCTVQCTGKTCGSDGCGGSCGVCGNGQRCNAAQTCEAVPNDCSRNCADRNCGADGCGSICGVCARTSSCTSNKCVAPGSSSAVSSCAFTAGSLLATLLVGAAAL